jgi:hypothetical protein
LEYSFLLVVLDLEVSGDSGHGHSRSQLDGDEGRGQLGIETEGLVVALYWNLDGVKGPKRVNGNVLREKNMRNKRRARYEV